MRENYRRFDVADPFGRTWDVDFRWLQNGISIRHADTVDCKYYISNGEEKREAVVALSHPALVALAAERGRELTDAWCMRLAGLHIEHMIATWEDMDKTIVTLYGPELAAQNAVVEAAAEEARRIAQLTH